MAMTGYDLLQWLKAIPEDELKCSEIIIEAGEYHSFSVPKFYKGTYKADDKTVSKNKIYLVSK